MTIFVRAEASETLGRLPCHISGIRWFHNGQILWCLAHNIAESGPITTCGRRNRCCLGFENLVNGVCVPRALVGMIVFGLVV